MSNQPNNNEIILLKFENEKLKMKSLHLNHQEKAILIIY